MDFHNKLKNLFQELQNMPEGALFNPWFQCDEQHDCSQKAPAIRRKHLHTYLQQRIGSARVLFIAEAVGYQGGHFSGIAMTSERIILGHHKPVHGITPKQVARDFSFRRTSKPEIKANGMTEPTATIIWKALNTLDIDPYSTVFWNALPWHPYDPEKGFLSNRTPTANELEAGLPALNEFLNIFEDTFIIAVGRKCEQCLQELGLPHYPVRHPANGGATKFRRQVKELFSENE
jgi:uracil-DNA glycosylase